MILRALLCLLLSAAAWAGEPPQQPFLRIEAGGHVGTIARMALDRSGRLLATAGFDKTVRLWSLPAGTPQRVLRPPIGLRQEGELYAVALSPDGGRVYAAGATGGQWDGTFAIYLFETSSGRFLGLLGGLPAPVADLAVSPDGTRLAAGLAQGGLRVWDAVNGKPAFEDKAYAGPVRSLIFDRAGRLFSTAADGKLRVYDPAGVKREAASPAGMLPWGLAVSPDGALLAVAYEGTDKAGKLRLDVLSSISLGVVFSPDTAGLAGEGLLGVAWAADGRGGVQLLAGGYAHGPSGYVIRRWADFGLGPPVDIAAAKDTVRQILALPGGGAVYAAEDPGWGLIAGDGKLAKPPAPPMADLRPSRDFGMAVTEGAVRFATPAGRQVFSLAEHRLEPDAAPWTAPPLPASLTGWKDSNAPKLNGERLALERTEITRSAAAAGDAVLLGTDTHLRLFGRDRKEIASVEVPAPAWAVAVGSGVAVAALLDGSIRWYGLKEGLAERAALFAHADGRRWVLFTPEGLFDAAAQGGDELVGMQLNRGRNQAPEWLSFSQAYRVLYAPTAVKARVLGDAAPAQARLAELGDLRTRLARQPLVEVESVCLPQATGGCTPLSLPSPALPEAATRVRITAKLTDRGLGVGAMDVFVNDRNAGRQTTGVADITLDPGENSIVLRAYDAKGTIYSETAPLSLLRAGATAGGKLYVLAVGIDHYGNPDLTLKYAVADAQRFATDVKAGATPLYRDVDLTVLTDATATRAGILGAFDRLARVVRPQDTFLFYVASHGVLDEGSDRFLLIPSDLKDISTMAAIAKQAIDEPTLIAALARIEARDALLFLDTCHSGKVTADSLANMGHETGRYLLAASSSVQEALDSYDSRNGVFVYALHEALTGSAGQDADGNVGALALGEFVSRRVGQLARSKAHEQDAVFRTAQRELRSFPIARIAK